MSAGIEEWANATCPCRHNWQTGEYHHSDCPEAKKLRDSWCTPADVAELLPEVDIDPATNLRTRIKARKHIIWEKGEDAKLHRWQPGLVDRARGFWCGDGLKVEWCGSMFLNGPYSDMLPWTQKANDEWGAKRLNAAIFLVKLDPTTQWWRQLVSGRDEKNVRVWLPRKRLNHIAPPRIKPSTNNFASAIVTWNRLTPRDVAVVPELWRLDLKSIAERWT